MESPFSAVIVSGEKTRSPLPTSTAIVLASERGRMARRGRAWRSMTELIWKVIKVLRR